MVWFRLVIAVSLNSPQYKFANMTNFSLAVPLEMN